MVGVRLSERDLKNLGGATGGPGKISGGQRPPLVPPSSSTGCITLLWLHHNHKMSIRYHKNGLASSYQTVGRLFIFMCFVIRIF